MKIAVLFPGYGSQFVGMGKELYDEYRIVQEYFEEAANCLDMNFVKLCFASSDYELAKMEHAYPSMFLISCSIYALLCEKGLQADVLAGYNQGEYAALCVGGGISFPDGLYLLNKLSLFYQDALAIFDVQIIEIHGLSDSDVEKICVQASSVEHKVFVAIYREAYVHIVAGHQEAVAKARTLAFAYEHATVEIVSQEYGVHSPLIDDVVNQFKIYLEKVDFKDMRVPLINSNNGTLVGQGGQVKDRVVDNINQAIRWQLVMEQLQTYDTIIEVGPGTLLSTMLKNKYPDKHIYAINQRTDIEKLQQIIPSMHTKQE